MSNNPSRALVYQPLHSAEQQKVNKHPKFQDNLDIGRQLECFKYEMNQTLHIVSFD